MIAPPNPSPASIDRWANQIRHTIISTVTPLGEGYISQGLGAAELFAALYFAELKYDPSDPSWDERDRFLLSTAHNSLAMYSTLVEAGILPRAALATYGQDSSDLEIISSELVPGVEGTFGSLGQALSVGVGVALSLRRRGSDARTYVMLGDGEMQEGQVWEAAMSAASFRLGNLCGVLDLNGMQVQGNTADVIDMGDVAAKWAGFGWSVCEIDGHDVLAILEALAQARQERDRPTTIIARTEPGHGVESLAGLFKHYAKISPQQSETALASLAESLR